jgi:tape measure domain-containing protein
MAVIRPEDIFDFDSYQRQLNELNKNAQAWADSTVTWIDRVGAAYKATQREAETLVSQISKLSFGNQKDATGAMSAYAQKVADVITRLETARQAEAQLSQARELNNQVVVDLTNRLVALKQRYDSLDPSQKGYRKEQQAILSETRSVTRAIDAQSKSLKVGRDSAVAAEGSLSHLKQQTSQLKKSLDLMGDAYDLSTGKINEQNKAAVALNNQYQKNLAVIKKVEQGQGIFNRNVGNYPKQEQSPLSGAGSSLLSGAGTLIGITSALDAVQKVNDVTLQFDSLDSALKVVSNDTDLFVQRQRMLEKASEDLGQDLSLVEEQYTSLTASSLGTRLEGEATDKIFNSIVSTMGRLKKPSEQTERALLAIGQMMSKGTVASEELKGQLAETLPGSFSIAARAIGVTTSKLTDMLQKGEVIASDFLPKFADELERTFNPNHEKRVEGLAATFARVRNEGVEWVKMLDIGGAMSGFIGWVTQGSRSIREMFASSVEKSNNRLMEQTEKVKELESALPALLTRYDELKTKTNLSATEQKELQTTINELSGIVPAAATGFDQYGNALDINKGKVLAYTQAQRELNAELNKQVLSDLTAQATKQVGGTKFLQNNLKQGVKVRNPYLGAEDMTADDKKEAAGQLRGLNEQAQTTIKQIIANGGTLTGELRKYVEQSGDFSTKQLLLIDDTNQKIFGKQAEAAVLFQKADKDSLKKREAVLKELKTLEDQRREILNPTLPGKKPTADDDPAAERRRKAAEAARKKAQAEAERNLRESLSKSEATSTKELAILNDQHQDGLMSEQDFIEQRLSLTLAGLKTRQAMLDKAGKKETDDYQKVLSAKTKAETDYKRSQLQLDLKSNKSSTDSKLSTLDSSRNEGSVPELDYVEQRHSLLLSSIRQEQAILKDAGQEGSELYKQAYQRQLDKQSDYFKRRFDAQKKAWKDELSEAKESLKLVNETAANDLEDRLSLLDKLHANKVNRVKLDVAKNNITPAEGDTRLFALEMGHLKDQAKAYETAYAKDRTLSNALVDDKIEKLKNLRDYGMMTASEVAEANKQITDLEKVRQQEAADDKISLDKKVADNSIAQSDRSTEHEVQNINKAKQKRDALIQMGLEFAQSIGNATFSVLSSNTERESQTLEKQHQNDLKLAGDNADAKTKIDEQYDKRRAEIARKQAVQEREQALFSIAIRTAMGVASVLSTGGGTYYADLGISAGLLTAFVVATGALEAAAVLAQPLPAYRIGKRAGDSYEGPALAGEAGTELYVDRKGKAQLLTKPTIINTKRGDTIYTASETSRLVQDWKRQEQAQQTLQQMHLNDRASSRLQEGRLNEQVLIYQKAGQNATPPMSADDMYEAHLRALRDAPRHETHIDVDGQREYYRDKDNLIEYLNRKPGK